MRIPVLLIVNWSPRLPCPLETRPELGGGSGGDPWRQARQGACCSPAAWSEARQALPQLETRGKLECQGRREGEGAAGCPAPHRAHLPAASEEVAARASSPYPHHPTKPTSWWAGAVPVSKSPAWLQLVFLITRLRSPWVCQRRSRHFCGAE